MGRNRSLDEFFGESNDGEADADAAEGGRDGGGLADATTEEKRAPADAPAADADDIDAGQSAGDPAGDDPAPEAGDDPGEADAESEAASEGRPESDGDAVPAEVTPATPTYRAIPGGECAACEAAADRLWRDGDAFVCADCKEW